MGVKVFDSDSCSKAPSTGGVICSATVLLGGVGNGFSTVVFSVSISNSLLASGARLQFDQVYATFCCGG